MSNEVREELNIPIRGTEAGVLAGFNGALSIPIGEVEVALSIGHTTRKTRFVIVEGAAHTLLGLDAMRAFGVIFDSVSGSLSIDGEGLRSEVVGTCSTNTLVSFTEDVVDGISPIHDFLFVYQEWPVENRVRPHFVGSSDALVVPFGKSTFVAPGKWKRIPLPYRLRGPCQVYNNEGVRGLIASYVMGKNGSLWMTLYNGNSTVTVVAGRTGAVLARTQAKVVVVGLDGEERVAVPQVRTLQNNAVVEKADRGEEKIKREFQETFSALFSTSEPVDRCMDLVVRMNECPCNMHGRVSAGQFPYVSSKDVPDWAMEKTIRDYEAKGYLERVEHDMVDIISPAIFITKQSAKPEIKVRLLADLRGRSTATLRSRQRPSAMCRQSSVVYRPNGPYTRRLT